MKQKNSKWVVYIILFVLFGTICYLGIHQITPLSKHIEQDISVNIR